MDVPLHSIVKGLDIACVLSDQKGGEIVDDHGLNCASAPTSSVGIADALRPISERDGGYDQLKMTVVAMHGIRQDFAKGHGKIPHGNGLDGLHMRPFGGGSYIATIAIFIWQAKDGRCLSAVEACRGIRKHDTEIKSSIIVPEPQPVKRLKCRIALRASFNSRCFRSATPTGAGRS